VSGGKSGVVAVRACRVEVTAVTQGAWGARDDERLGATGRRLASRSTRMTTRVGRVACTGLAVLLACLRGPPALAEEPHPRSAHPTADGASIVDEEASLVWARCVEGMRWNGVTCVGEASSMNHAEALAAGAARAKTDGLPWRLPRVGEMQHLVRRAQPARPELFPAAPEGWHWSGTAVVDQAPVNQYRYGNIRQHITDENANRIEFLHGCAVDLLTGQARDDVLKRTRLPVRLVRSLN